MPLGTRTALLTGPLVLLFISPGCGVPPCFEGRLHVELLEVEENTCLFEEWPGGSEFTIRAVGNQQKKNCTIQAAEYADISNDAIVKGGYGMTGRYYSEWPTMAYLEVVEFSYDDCSVTTGGRLLIDRRYDDVDAALEGQKKGDDEAFHVSFAYRSDCGHLITDASSDNRLSCANTYRAHVSRP